MAVSRQEDWSGLSFPPPGDLPNLGWSAHLLRGRQILYRWATREPQASSQYWVDASFPSPDIQHHQRVPEQCPPLRNTTCHWVGRTHTMLNCQDWHRHPHSHPALVPGQYPARKKAFFHHPTTLVKEPSTLHEVSVSSYTRHPQISRAALSEKRAHHLTPNWVSLHRTDTLGQNSPNPKQKAQANLPGNREHSTGMPAFSLPTRCKRHKKRLSTTTLKIGSYCPTLCNAMECSTPGFPVLRHHPEFVHVHRVSDAIQSSPLLSPSPPAFNLSQHQGLSQWVSSSHRVARVLEFQLQDQSFQWIFRTDFL